MGDVFKTAPGAAPNDGGLVDTGGFIKSDGDLKGEGAVKTAFVRFGVKGDEVKGASGEVARI